jgi:integral membrane sensor domain MASE1
MMKADSSNRPSRFWPYAASLVGLGTGYFITLYLSQQLLLAVGAAACGALFGFLLARIVQMKGRVSLSMLAIGFPLLVAIACALLLQLQGFRDRQRGFDELRMAGVGFRARQPQQADE